MATLCVPGMRTRNTTPDPMPLSNPGPAAPPHRASVQTGQKPTRFTAVPRSKALVRSAAGFPKFFCDP